MIPTEPSADTTAATRPIDPARRFPPTDVGPGPRAENEARLGRRIGPYRLQRLLGHGGMGAVYLARRDDGEFERDVALKLIRMGGEDELSRRRFERERRILSRLEHPAIARLYDGGVDDESGAPWFAMELIEGENLTQWCAHQRLSPRERVRLIIAIGHAVQYAHQQLVIHRDLKPSNIMVDASGAPHVLDFGIGALLDEHDADSTSPRTAIHTPEYAAPEQIDGAPISAATDVYTLGVLLYEQLVGVRPYEDEHATAFAIQRAVLEQPTPALAARMPASAASRQTLADERAITPAQWRRVLRSDLDAIVRKALEKRPEERYPTMSSFVADLQRWLDGRPVQAARAGIVYRSRKFVRRHRLALALVAGVFVVLTAFTLLSLVQARKAQQQAERAEAVKQFLVSLFQQARPGSGSDALSAQQLLDEGRVRLQREMGDQPRLSGELLNTIGNAYAHLGDYGQAATQLERALSQLPANGDTLRPRLDVLVDLVDLYSHQGKGDDGERHAAEALAIVAHLRRAEASPWAWLDARSRLPRTYFGDAAQSLESRAEDLALARARLLDLRGERDAAIDLRRAVADVRDARPGEHPTRVRTAQNDLALALSEAGLNDEAIERFERLLRDNAREFGPEHASGITMRHNLALALRRVDRLADAERIERANVAIAARELPPSHPMQAYVQNTLASILRQQQRPAEAQRWYAQARAVFDGQPDIDRGMLATVHYNESLNRLALFDLAGASTSIEAADAVWSAAYGSSYPRRIAVALQRAAIALQSVDATRADAALAALDALLVAHPAPEPRDTLRAAWLHAQRQRLAGDAVAAGQVLARHDALVEPTWPAPHVEHIGWLLLRAQLALDRGERDAARRLLDAAVAQQEERDAATLPELALLAAALACDAADTPRCATHAHAADDAYATFLDAAAPPRQLARAWATRASACSRPGDAEARAALDAQLAALAGRVPAPDIDALRAACTAR